MSPTQRTLHLLREEGYLAEVVERWVPVANVRRDLFGFGDVIAIRDGTVLLVQCTSDSHVSARVNKIRASPYLPQVRSAMQIEVHGWKKVGRRWQVRRKPI